MRKPILSAATMLGLIAGSATGAENPVFGVVNFETCFTDSKMGKKEQENMESMRKQVAALMEGKEKELKEIAAKFEDSEYLDSLSPKAEEEMKNRFQSLQEELGQSQNQYYQIMQHAQYTLIHKLNDSITKAAEKIAQEKSLDYVLNKNVCYYIRPDLDVTTSVIAEMDSAFELEAKADNLSETGSEPPLNEATEAVLEQDSE